MLCQIHPCPLSQGPLRSVKTRRVPLCFPTLTNSFTLIHLNFFPYQKMKKKYPLKPIKHASSVYIYTSDPCQWWPWSKEWCYHKRGCSHTRRHANTNLLFWLYPKREFGSLKRYWCWYWSGGGGGTCLIPDLQEAVPRASGHCHAVFCHT